MATQQECIDACMECAKVCDMCAAACLGEKDLEPLRRCLVLALDCSEICNAAARIMARDSENESEICKACAEVCERLAEESRIHEALEFCALSADAAAYCARLCRQMSGPPAARMKAFEGVPTPIDMAVLAA